MIAVIEMSQSSWLVAGIVPGIERQPLKKLTADQEGLLNLLHRWRKEAGQAGRTIKRITVAFEAGRDGFWLARWLQARDIDTRTTVESNICTRCAVSLIAAKASKNASKVPDRLSRQNRFHTLFQCPNFSGRARQVIL